MSAGVESGRPPSSWRHFWLGALQWLSCGLCSRDWAGRSECCAPPSLQQLQPGYGEQTQDQSMCLLDLNDDCLLEIFDRLGIKERLRFRVNRRLYALELSALPLNRIEDRVHYGYREFNELNEECYSKKLQSRRMLHRAAACCTFAKIDIMMTLDFEPQTIDRILRNLVAGNILIYGEGEVSLHLVHSLQSFIRRNRMLVALHLALDDDWEVAEIQMINQAILATRTCFLSIFNLSRETAQHFTRLEMGIDDDAYFDDPTIYRHIDLRTSMEDKEVILATGGAGGDRVFLGVSQGARISAVLYDPDDSQFSIVVWRYSDVYEFAHFHRVLYQEQ